mmetsp:Transcript_20187/g.50959  ORF Transcript_20187/g.50959 Transcript_20187/m.50959 type:complete len:185 (+) Transcript_20187:1118-1672(+)
MEAILVHERSLRGGPPQHLLPKNASTTANGFEDSPAFNISPRSSCSTSSSHQNAFMILTAFRKLVRLFLLGVQTVVGVLDSQRLPPDKNKSKERQEQYRFGPVLYGELRTLFAAFDLLVVESAHEGEALCAAVQDRLFRHFGQLRDGATSGALGSLAAATSDAHGFAFSHGWAFAVAGKIQAFR